ncbi:MAG TPA: acetyltransferase [Polyangia bacterium]
MMVLPPPRPLVLIGGGEHAAVVAEAARLQEPDRAIAGFIDHRAPTVGPFELPYLGADQEGLRLAAADTHDFVIAVGGSGVNSLRQSLAARYEAAGARFASIIHPRAVVATSALVGAGAVVLTGAIVNPRVVVGAHAVINSGAVIEHDVRVGEHTLIGPGAVLGGGVLVGPDCFLGLGCRVRDHVTIGRGVLLAMGAVLVGDAPDGAVMWGMPAVIREEQHADRS